MVLAARRRLHPGSWGPSGVRPPAPDEQLLDLVGTPFGSVADTRTRLREAEAYLRGRADRRSVFLTVYATMTGRVEAGIASGQFEDPDWIRAYLVAFANRYRRALVDFERGNDVPAPWELSFGASYDSATLLLQDALLGVSAHINYDLPYALRSAAIDPDRPAKRRDHDRINRVLEALVDVVQRSLADVYDAEGYRRLDRQLGSLDEAFTLIGLTEARTLAWRHAVRLTDTRSALLRRLVRWRIRTVATGAGAAILAPSADPQVRRRLRAVEGDEPPLEALQAAIAARAGAPEGEGS